MAEFVFRKYYCPSLKDHTYTDEKTGTNISFMNDCCFQIEVEASVKAQTVRHINGSDAESDFSECTLTNGILTIERPGKEPEIYEANENDEDSWEGVWDNEVVELLQDAIEDDLNADLDNEDNWGEVWD